MTEDGTTEKPDMQAFRERARDLLKAMNVQYAANGPLTPVLVAELAALVDHFAPAQAPQESANVGSRRPPPRRPF